MLLVYNEGLVVFECSDMGCHIDGFIAVVGHTHVIQDGPITGRAADVIAAANTAAEVALRLVRPGKNVSCSDGRKLLFYFLLHLLFAVCHVFYSGCRSLFTFNILGC